VERAGKRLREPLKPLASQFRDGSFQAANGNQRHGFGCGRPTLRALLVISIATQVGVTDKTVTKAIRWLKEPFDGRL